jgi:hypothetical protein
MRLSERTTQVNPSPPPQICKIVAAKETETNPLISRRMNLLDETPPCSLGVAVERMKQGAEYLFVMQNAREMDFVGLFWISVQNNPTQFKGLRLDVDACARPESVLEKCTSLVALALQNKRLECPIPHLPNLRELELYEHGDFNGLHELTSLETLIVNNSEETGMWQADVDELCLHLGGLKNSLKHLRLRCVALENLPQLDNLEILQLTHSQFNPETFSHSKLRVLDLSGTDFGEWTMQLETPKLKKLVLRGCHLLDIFCAFPPSLEILNISKNPALMSKRCTFTGDTMNQPYFPDISGWLDLPNLRTLHMNHMHLCGDMLERVCEHIPPRLERLNLKRNSKLNKLETLSRTFAIHPTLSNVCLDDHLQKQIALTTDRKAFFCLFAADLLSGASAAATFLRRDGDTSILRRIAQWLFGDGNKLQHPVQRRGE